jgi:hypothetical protein
MVNLTLCRRSDDRVFKLGQAIKNSQPYSIRDRYGKKSLYKNVSFLNEIRINVNTECMNKY